MTEISVIIPALNAAAFLPHCLEALSDAGFRRDEIVVVDDGSVDTTVEVAKAQGVTVIASEQRSGAAAARNRGAAMSTGDILFFVDADVRVHSDSRAVLLAFFADHPEFTAIFGVYDADPAVRKPISRARNLLHRYIHIENEGEIASFWTGCGALRREAFDKVGGFDETVRMMEDIDLGLRLSDIGRRTYLSAVLQGQHLKNWTFGSMVRTDFFDRALPWARLLRNSPPNRRNGLNINLRSRVSVIACAMGLVAAAVAVLLPGPGLLALAAAVIAIGAANRGFLRMVRDIDGWRALPAAFLVLCVYYVCGGFGFALVLLRLDGPLS
jgi:glycosyltransferase involved in cell wall biosynthesis